MNTEPSTTSKKAAEAVTSGSHSKIHTQEITIPSLGDALPVFVAKPHHQENLPVILVVQEVFGVNPHIKELCGRLASAGYMAIAPELYFREGDPREYSDIGALIQQLVNHVADRQVMADLDHVAHWAARHGGDINRLAITGFCWGGRIAWLYAAHNPQLKAAVAWYGRLMGDKTLNMPKHPVDIAKNLMAPVLGLYGAHDGLITLEQVATMRQAIEAANADAAIIVYPDAGHAFNADYRPSYHDESAQDGWQRMLDFFALHNVVNTDA